MMQDGSERGWVRALGNYSAQSRNAWNIGSRPVVTMASELQSLWPDTRQNRTWHSNFPKLRIPTFR